MENTLEMKNIKKEPSELISVHKWKSQIKRQMNSVNRQNIFSMNTKPDIKTEVQEDDSEYSVFAGTSDEICPFDYVKVETEETMVKIKCENMIDELMQDPLNVHNEIKDGEHLPTDSEYELRIKTEPTEKEKDESLSESDEDFDSHESASNFLDHLLLRNDSNHEDKKYICYECNKTFERKWDLDNHLRIHTDERPFTCFICEKSFNAKSSLNTHMLVHSGERPHVCDICKKAFRNKSNLIRHKLIHIGVKSFSCDECEKSFTHKHHLIIHKQIHAGIKPHVCGTCDKAFVKKSDLTIHTRIHTGEKPYSCNVCNKSFVSSSSLHQHKKFHKK